MLLLKWYSLTPTRKFVSQIGRKLSEKQIKNLKTTSLKLFPSTRKSQTTQSVLRHSRTVNCIYNSYPPKDTAQKRSQKPFFFGGGLGSSFLYQDFFLPNCCFFVVFPYLSLCFLIFPHFLLFSLFFLLKNLVWNLVASNNFRDSRTEKCHLLSYVSTACHTSICGH